MPRCLLVALLALLHLTSPLAAADLLVIVNRQNPVTSLSENEVRKIFLGRIRLYPRSNREIFSLDLAAQTAARRFFYQTLMNMDEAQLSGYRASYLFSGKGRLPEMRDNEQALLQAVSSHAEAIGYVTENHLLASPLREEVKVVFRLPWEDPDAAAESHASRAQKGAELLAAVTADHGVCHQPVGTHHHCLIAGQRRQFRLQGFGAAVIETDTRAGLGQHRALGLAIDHFGG